MGCLDLGPGARRSAARSSASCPWLRSAQALWRGSSASAMGYSLRQCSLSGSGIRRSRCASACRIARSARATSGLNPHRSLQDSVLRFREPNVARRAVDSLAARPQGTATACASTSVLMSAVFLVYVQNMEAWMLKYVGVAVASSMVGAYTGCAFASSLSPISINFFVGFMLVVCAVLAVVPSFFAGDDAETPGGETGRRRVLYDLELWWSVLRG